MQNGTKTILGISLLLFLVACGEDPTPVDTEDLGCTAATSDRDCAAEDISLLIRSKAEIEEFCTLGCNTIQGITFHGLEDVETLDGFGNLEKILGSLYIHFLNGPTSFSGFNNINEFRGIEFANSSTIQEITGFNGLEETWGAVSIFANRELERVEIFDGLKTHGEAATEQALNGIDFKDNPNLVEVAGFTELQEAFALRFVNNATLESIDTFDKLENVSTLVFRDNPELTSLPDFPALRRMEGNLVVVNNPQIRQCDVDRLLAQLDKQPEEINVSGVSDEPCD